uniref:Uncharacterized protein n=1 Tax=Tanacetum cinerariifolium TaxID=118510 RepID=A0A699GKL9_TANCI|nr:hypothetical protein [Tanacetum cinerariifolium]
MEDCHMLLTNQIDLVNPNGHRFVPDVSKPLRLGGSKERRSALSISKLKAANYPDFRLEELVSSSWIKSEREYGKNTMRETEVHKFSDGTLTWIMEKLDHTVKDFKLFKYNPGMETRIWSKDDRRSNKEFMEVIKARLKTRRFFKSLECFVSGRLRDVNYKLIQRTG